MRCNCVGLKFPGPNLMCSAVRAFFIGENPHAARGRQCRAGERIYSEQYTRRSGIQTEAFIGNVITRLATVASQHSGGMADHTLVIEDDTDEPSSGDLVRIHDLME
jgi:hypothetical protein